MRMRKARIGILVFLAGLFLISFLWAQSPPPIFVDALPSSGNKTVDKQVKEEIGAIEKLFGVNPNWMWYNDEDSPNAMAVPYGSRVGNQGTTYLGKNYFAELAKSPQPGANIATTLAHEYAHVLQMKKWGANFDTSSSKYIELHSDYLSGYYLRLKNYPLDDYLKEQFNSGDYLFEEVDHHGTPSERMKSLIAGYRDAVYGGKTLSAHQAFLKGQTFVEKFPKPTSDDPVWGDAKTPKKDDNPVDHTKIPGLKGDRELTTVEKNMINLLLSTSTNVRTKAATALGNSGEKALGAIGPLSAALSDKNQKVRTAAAEALAKLGKLRNPGAEGGRELISEEIEDGTVVVTDYTRAGEMVPLVALTLDLENKDKKEKIAAMAVLEELGSAAHAAIPDLTDYLSDEDKALRTSAAKALGAIGIHGVDGKSVLPSLRRALDKEKDSDVRKALVGALGSLGRPAVSTLVGRLGKGSTAVRILIAEALGNMGADGSTARSALKKAATSQNKDLQKAAKKALEKIEKAITTPGAINTLRRTG